MVNFCWIDPAGKVYPVESHRHGAFARSYLGQPDLSVTEETYTLVDRGWLRVSVAEGLSNIPFSALPEAQASALMLLASRVMSGLIRQNILAYINA